MYFKPVRLLEISISNIEPVDFWEDYSDPNDIWIGYPYTFNVTMTVNDQYHSSNDTPIPMLYTGLDIQVGDWIASGPGGRSLRINEIISNDGSTVIAKCEDVFRFNTVSDTQLSGDGSIPISSGYVFTVDDSGMPNFTGLNPNFLPYNAVTDLISRFSAFNEYKQYIRKYKENHDFAEGDIIYLDSDGVYQKIVADSDNKDNLSRIVGSVSTINIPGAGSFTIKPAGNYERDINPPLPEAAPGSLIYLSTDDPGKLTAEKPAKNAVPIYIRLDSDTEGVRLVGGSGGASQVYSTTFSVADNDGLTALPLDEFNIGDSVYVENNNTTGKWAVFMFKGLDGDDLPIWELISTEQMTELSFIPIPADRGGTGFDSFADGDLLVGNEEDGLHKLLKGEVGEVLTATEDGLEWQIVTHPIQDKIESGDTGVYTNEVVDHVTANVGGKKGLDISSDETALNGEHLVVLNKQDRVELQAVSTEEGDIDLVLRPQGDGAVGIISEGDATITTNPGEKLTITVGNSATGNAGDVYIQGGTTADEEGSAGNVYLLPGKNGDNVSGQVLLSPNYEPTSDDSVITRRHASTILYNATFSIVDTDNYTINANDGILLVNIDPEAESWNINLPTMDINSGRQYTIKDANGISSTVPLRISGGGNLIDGEEDIFIEYDYEGIVVLWNGASWNII